MATTIATLPGTAMPTGRAPTAATMVRGGFSDALEAVNGAPRAPRPGPSAGAGVSARSAAGAGSRSCRPDAATQTSGHAATRAAEDGGSADTADAPQASAEADQPPSSGAASGGAGGPAATPEAATPAAAVQIGLASGRATGQPDASALALPGSRSAVAKLRPGGADKDDAAPPGAMIDGSVPVQTSVIVPLAPVNAGGGQDNSPGQPLPDAAGGAAAQPAAERVAGAAVPFVLRGPISDTSGVDGHMRSEGLQEVMRGGLPAAGTADRTEADGAGGAAPQAGTAVSAPGQGERRMPAGAPPAPMAGEAAHGVRGADIEQSAVFAAGDTAAPVRPAEAASPAPGAQAMAAAAKDSDGSADDGPGAGGGLPVLQAAAAGAGAVMSSVVTDAAQTAAPAHASGASAPPPVEQVAAAVVNITKSPDSNPQVTLHLQPGELGAVEIRIERSAAGLTHIDITAAKPETLAALQSSQAQLHQSLDLAGVPAAGRSITFHMPEASPAQTATATGLADAGGSGAGQAGAQSEGGGRGGFPGQPRQTQDPGPVDQPVPAVDGTFRPQRIGLDITA